MKETMKFNYDKEGDFAEIMMGDPTPCYATELEPGIFIRKDEKTNEVKSISIIGFRKRFGDI
ncbi:TPA: DUF2283 domain-containing protein [Candidatus Woesearchaeota archaeon]|nr:hypothetical protein [archaeon]HIJ10788.1 DUF2283 domain-containing protein [Candidatus Woesearchaeota archaeon]|tara:strand:+ start:508 stop:693 length:186 start_codon:yes stop_codon:yes gene_type:complete